MDYIKSLSIGIATVLAAGLVMHYGEDLPLIKQAKEGFNR